MTFVAIGALRVNNSQCSQCAPIITFALVRLNVETLAA